MAQQDKQIGVGARESFAYYSEKSGLLVNDNRYAVDSNTFFLSSEALYSFIALPCPNSDLLDVQVCTNLLSPLPVWKLPQIQLCPLAMPTISLISRTSRHLFPLYNV